jgi:hypothetical protein
LQALEKQGIQMVGRYVRWKFQGIADSIRDGLCVGAANRQLLIFRIRRMGGSWLPLLAHGD